MKIDNLEIFNNTKVENLRVDFTINDETKYYNLNSVKLIKNAFNSSNFQSETKILLVKGETDKIYLIKKLVYYMIVTLTKII